MEKDLFRLKQNLIDAVKNLSDHTEGSSRVDVDILAKPEPILYVMSQLLFMGDVVPDAGRLGQLHMTYDKYVQEHNECGFSFDDLFTEGWLINALDEWQFTNYRSLYENIASDDKHSREICEFIAGLSYPIERHRVRVDIYGENFQHLNAEIGKNLDWFIENELLTELSESRGQYALADAAVIWQRLGGLALGAARSQGMDLSRVLQLGCVLGIYANPSELPPGDCDEHAPLLECLMKEDKTWEQIGKILLMSANLAYRGLTDEQMKRLAIPKSIRQRYEWLGREMYEEVCHLPHETYQAYVFHYFLRRYSKLGIYDRERFCALLSKPLYQLMVTWTNMPVPLVECLPIEQTRFFMLLALTEKLQMSSGQNLSACKALADYILGLHMPSKELVEYLVFLSFKDKVHGRNWHGYLYLYQKISKQVTGNAPSEAVAEAISIAADGLANAEPTDVNHYLGVLLDLSQGARRMHGSTCIVSYTCIYDAVVNWLQRGAKEDLLFSTLPKSVWGRADWQEIVLAVADKAKDFFGGLEQVLPDTDNERLRFSKLAEFHLRIGLIWLTWIKENISTDKLEKLQIKFIRFFFSAQAKLHLFSGDYLRIFNNEDVLAQILGGFPGITERGQEEFKRCLEASYASLGLTLIFWFPYIKVRSWQDSMLSCLPSVLSKGVDSVASYPALSVLADNLVDIGMELYGEDDDTALPILLESLQNIYKLFESHLSNLSDEQDNYATWLQTLRKRILLLEKNWSQLEQDDFYLAYHKLENGKIDDLREAMRILQPHFERGEVSYTFNYMVSAARLIEKLSENTDDYRHEMEEFRKASDWLEKHKERIQSKVLWQLYYYRLVVSIVQENTEQTYRLYWSMPEEFRQEFHCALLIANFMLDKGHYKLAEDISGQLSRRYGDDEDVLELKKRIYTCKGATLKNGGALQRQSFLMHGLEKDPVQRGKEAMDCLRGLSMENQAASIQYDVTQEMAINFAARERSSGRRELFLLVVMLQVAAWVQAYSPRLVYDAGDDKPMTSPEDTYNKLAAKFIDAYDWDLKAFVAKDQTQEGARSMGKSGRQTAGEIDILVEWQKQPVAIIEGIKLSSISKELQEHINKLSDYNRYLNVLIAVMFVYVNTRNSSNFKKRYKEKLKYFLSEKKYGIRGVAEAKDLGWPLSGINSSSVDFLRTRHCFEEDGYDQVRKIDLYHVFIEIG